MTTAAPLVALAAGGTGGHLFPAQALAAALGRRGYRLVLFTDRRGAAWRDGGIDIATYRVSAARLDGGVAAKLAGLACIAIGFVQARRLYHRLAPAAVIGFGGYPTVPLMLAAHFAGFATMIHEQNAVMGRANRLLAPRVDRIATAFADVAGIRPTDAAKIVHTGNPVRGAIIALAERPFPALSGGAEGARVRLFVIGGSQGARILSAVVPAAIASLPQEMRARLSLAQQCRAEDIERVREIYAKAAIAAELATFFDDVPNRLAAAHLVISRAGASTVAELAVAGRPAILVPFAAATDDHQTANARALDQAGGAWLIPEAAFTAEVLSARLQSFLTLPASLARAAAAARMTALPDAAERLADVVESLIGRAGGSGASVRGREPRREAAA